MSGFEDLVQVGGKGEIVDTSIVEQLTRGEVDMQVATAKKYPRSIARFQADARSMATINQDTAASCFYVLKRSGSTIEGPSARLAEIVASCWGNMRAETRVVDEGQKFITAQATCWDMERNVLVRIEVKRRITGKDGRRFSDDMIVVTANAASSIALRNAVFKVVPFAYVDEIYEECRKVAVGSQRPLADLRQESLQYFAKLGIEQDRVLAFVGKPSLEDVGVEDLVTLRGVATAIKEGTTSIDEAFPDPNAKKETKKTLTDLTKEEKQ